MRYTVGRLPGAEVGTIVGPKDITGEYLCVFAEDGSLGYATTHELQAAVQRVSEGDVRSVTEHQWNQEVHRFEVAFFRSLFV